MQLFIIDRNPAIAAMNLADCHVRKQILETAQLLTSTWINDRHILIEGMARPQNSKHPVALAINHHNFWWVCDHFKYFLLEFRRRFNKDHKYINIYDLYSNLYKYPSKPDYNVVNSFYKMFHDFTPHSDNIIEAYREYYIHKSKIILNFKYTNTTPPVWLITK